MEEQKEAHILGSPDFVDIASTRKYYIKCLIAFVN